MKTKTIFTIIMILSFAVPTAFSQSVTLDGVSGLDGSGYIPVDGGTVTFTIGMNVNGTGHTGITNGFSISSPDGATWTTTVGDTIPAGWDDWFDLIFAINPFSITGESADTVGFGGASLFGGGIPGTFNQAAYTITIGPFDEADRGKTIVLDSCFYPPTGTWKWAGPVIYPTWDGPHTYLVDPPELSDDIIATPDTLMFSMLTNFEGTMTDSFMVSSSGGDFDFSLSEGSPWLTLSQANGTTPEYILVDVSNPGPEGLHTTDIEITSAFAVNSPQFVTVQVEVIEPPKYLEIDPTELNFTAQVGHGNPGIAYVQVSEVNDYEIAFEAHNNDSWIDLIDSAGTTPGSVGIQIEIAGLTPGTYVDTVYYNYDDDPQDGSTFYTLITLELEANAIPELALSGNEFFIDECESVSISYTATDDDGDPLTAWLEPVIDNMTILQPAGGSGSVSFDPDYTQAGVYNITAYLTDGIDTVSSPLTITVADCEVQLEPKAVMSPYRMLALFVDALEPMTGTVGFGDFADGHTANDVDLSTVVIDGFIVPTANSIGTWSTFSTEIVNSEFDINTYLDQYMPFFDSTMQEFTVSGQFNDATPFSITGEVMLRGHLSGDLNLDGVVDIGDLVFAVEFAFHGGPAPQYIESLDLNKDGSSDITDIILLIQIMF